MPSYPQTIRQFFDREIRPGSRIIDVGCGNGVTVNYLAGRKPDCEFSCVDSDDVRVHRANSRLRRSRRSPAIRCRPCAAEDLTREFGRSRFDCAITSHTLHHFWDPLRVLRQVRGVLRDGGLFLLAELDPVYGEQLDDCPRFSLRKIVSLARDAGFRRVSGRKVRPGVLLIRAVR